MPNMLSVALLLWHGAKSGYLLKFYSKTMLDAFVLTLLLRHDAKLVKLSQFNTVCVYVC